MSGRKRPRTTNTGFIRKSCNFGVLISRCSTLILPGRHAKKSPCIFQPDGEPISQGQDKFNLSVLVRVTSKFLQTRDLGSSFQLESHRNSTFVSVCEDTNDAAVCLQNATLVLLRGPVLRRQTSGTTSAAPTTRCPIHPTLPAPGTFEPSSRTKQLQFSSKR